MPTPLAVLSKAAVTLFKTMKERFFISDKGGMGKFWILLHLSMGFIYSKTACF